MKSEQFEAFLKTAGNSFASENAKFGSITTFSERGYEYSSLNYDNDSDLLHLRCQCSLPEAVEPTILADLLLKLEVEYPIVKLCTLGSGKTLGFEVSTEQFETDPSTIESMFWRTIDLMRDVINECYRRLQPAPTDAVAADGFDEWVSGIENALRSGCPASSCERSSVPARLRASLGLVLLTDRSTGSAFCVHATASASFYITNAHVVEGTDAVTIYRQTPTYEKMVGTVVAKGDVKNIDLAIVSVPTGDIASLDIHDGSIEADAPAGLAGYARVQIWAAETVGELTPSIHFGTITSINKSGSTILHDALSRPGNSGGPLFDPLTGNVLGVEKGGWEGEEEAMAVGASALTSFLLKHAATFATALAQTPAVDPPIPKRTTRSKKHVEPVAALDETEATHSEAPLTTRESVVAE